MSSPIVIRPVVAGDLPAIDQLNDRAFGPGRFAKTAHRLREGMPEISAACLAAEIGNSIVAAVRFTPITIGGRAGALLLGPLAVEPRLAGQGLGRRLVTDGLTRARQHGWRLVVLVGDPPYYERRGFRPVPMGQMQLPGPVDYKRLLAAELQPGALGSFSGMLAGDAHYLPVGSSA
jgi:predicted N-acetyltransferase YhbS